MHLALTKIFCTGCITRGSKGREICELHLMKESGAVGFTDGNKSIENTRVMRKALSYAKSFNGLIIQHAEEPNLSKDGNANASAYSAGKAGAIALTKSLGKELADKNIAVNAVTPAGAKTRILYQMTKEHVQRMLSKVPRGRFLEVEEFTSLVCWLSSEENTFSTAAVFDISGGRSTYLV